MARADSTDLAFRIDAGELVLTVPAGGVRADCLAQPLTELGLAPRTAAHVLRVEAPPGWRWSTVDAAFLAAVVGELDGRARLDVRGVPKELQSLVDLARAGPAAADRPPGARVRRADVWKSLAACGPRALPIIAIVVTRSLTTSRAA